MGTVYAEITLRNSGDVAMQQRGVIKEAEVRQVTVTAMVDTGAATLVINEDIRRQLGLEPSHTFTSELADGSIHLYTYTEPVQMQWKDRTATSEAILIPTASEALLGAIALEAMDLIINPLKQEITGAHGDHMVLRV